MVNMTNPTPGTPAVPIDAKTAIPITVIYPASPSSTPYTLARNTVATPCMIAVPSMLIVAPNGTVNEATELSTPTRCVTDRNVTGIVAFEDAVENAKICAGRIFCMNTMGLRPVNSFSRIIKVTNKCRNSATTNVMT